MDNENVSLAELNREFQPIVSKVTFPQVINAIISVLRNLHTDESFEDLYKRIDFTMNPSFAAHRSEVHSVRFDRELGEFKVLVVLNVFGLYGASSPLPIHYSEKILQAEEDSLLQPFMNLFQHRVHSLLFPIWQKYRYYAAYRGSLYDGFSFCMLALLGFSAELRSEHNLDFKRLLPFFGILAMKQASIGIIGAVLKHYFSHRYIEFTQCLLRVAEIPCDQRNSLGCKNSVLGETMVLGRSVYSCNDKFRMIIFQLRWSVFLDFLPNGTLIGSLRTLMLYILKEPLSYDICLKIMNPEIVPCCLGRENMFLGWSTWLSPLPEEGQTHFDLRS